MKSIIQTSTVKEDYIVLPELSGPPFKHPKATAMARGKGFDHGF